MNILTWIYIFAGDPVLSPLPFSEKTYKNDRESGNYLPRTNLNTVHKVINLHS